MSDCILEICCALSGGNSASMRYNLCFSSVFEELYATGGLGAHLGTRVRIMKRRVRTAAMPFLLSVLVLCLSNHCMLVQLMRRKGSSTEYLTAASL